MVTLRMKTLTACSCEMQATSPTIDSGEHWRKQIIMRKACAVAALEASQLSCNHEIEIVKRCWPTRLKSSPVIYPNKTVSGITLQSATSSTRQYLQLGPLKNNGFLSFNLAICCNNMAKTWSMCVSKPAAPPPLLVEGHLPSRSCMDACMHACIYESMRVYNCIILYIHI